MEATQMLMEEHRLIERVITALESVAQRLRNGEEVELEFFRQAADFIRNFADGCHHAKEEGVLFEAMKAAGMPAEGGPIAVMLMEHDQGRQYTARMATAAERLEQGDQDAVEELVTGAMGYSTLLRQHIQKEDQILFPMADNVISAERQDQVLHDCKAAEEVAGGQDIHAKYRAVADRLVALAGVTG
jgi:hemerythrin-like domain-containing protein